MFSLYKKELQSYFLSPAAYAVLAFFTLTFSLTMIMDISAASSLYEFSFTSLFYTNLFYLAILFPVLTMRSFSEERKNKTDRLPGRSASDTCRTLRGGLPHSQQLVL